MKGGAGPSPPAGFHPRPVPGASGLVPPGPRQPTQVGRGTGERGLGKARTIAGCSDALSSGSRFQGDVGLGWPDLWFLKSRWKSGFSHEIS